MTKRQDTEDESWPARFERLHGRRLRVLHIGNVANNAYLNAKILNAQGVDCDVVCADYYHIMACPEWEDADFAGDYGDQFFPDWEAVRLNGFQRPRWFAQGPLRCCIAYLNAKRGGWRLAGWLRWSYLRLRRWYACSPRLRGVRTAVDAVRAGWLGRIVRRLKHEAVWGCCVVGAVVRRLTRSNHPSARSRGTSTIQGCPSRAVSARPCAGNEGRWDANRADTARLGVSDPSRNHATPFDGWSFDRRIEDLIAEFARVFPDRPDPLTPADLVRNRTACLWWKRLLRRYDVVVGYAIEGRWPLLAGTRPYFAYEHGTIRNIPFEANEQGRVCAITYRLADGVFITNCDNIRSVGPLGLERYRFVPHPVNEDLSGDRRNAERLREELRRRLQSDFLVFHPPRQHWEPRRHPDWEKGNDILIRGFARFVREVNPRAGAIFVEWGQTIQASKDLLDSLGVADRVLWIPPQPNVAMIRYTRACDLLADQFFLGAFGSTMPKGLLHGCPAMLYLDEDRHRWCFPEMPPVLNAATPEQVFEGMARLYRDPQYARDLVARGRAWYDRYHSNQVIAETFLTAFREVLEASAPAAESGDVTAPQDSAPGAARP